MQRLILARHGHAHANAAAVTSCTPPGEGLSDLGREQVEALRVALAGTRVDLGVSTRLLRARETLEGALAEREVPQLTMPELDEIHFGSFDGGSVEDYRRWAWSASASAPCPGGGESRGAVAHRLAGALELLLARPENAILAVGHALPLRYVLDAAEGRAPAARIAGVPHATPFELARDAVERARDVLAAWSAAPQFRL